MTRITFGDIKSAVARVLGVCTTDSRVAETVNAAQQRLCNRGKFVGTMVRYRICVTEGCLTWPRQINTIEAYSVCDSPGTVRDQWFEFLGHGPGIMSSDCGCSMVLVDRDPRPTFDNIAGDDKKIKVYADVTESATARILIQGYDENANWIRTLDSGSWVDGEYVAINTTGAISTKIFTSITGIIKPVTNGIVRIYEYDPATLAQRALGIYEPDETRPIYRSSLIPGLSSMGSSSGSTCDRTSVTVLAKLKPMPISSDNDWLLLGNAEAIKLMCKAILFEEQDMLEQALGYETAAIRLLEDELSTFLGDGVVPAIRVQHSSEWGGGGTGVYVY